MVNGFEGRAAAPLPDQQRLLDSALRAASCRDTTLREGAHGHDVVMLQRALRACGRAVVVDGDFGPQTETAVKAYQKAPRHPRRPVGSDAEHPVLSSAWAASSAD